MYNLSRREARVYMFTVTYIDYDSPVNNVAPPPQPCRELEKELARLIVGGQIAARIDSQAKVLYAR
jgi:hypothetical protein